MKHPFILYAMADELSGCQRSAVQTVLRHSGFEFETPYWASLVRKRWQLPNRVISEACNRVLQWNVNSNCNTVIDTSLIHHAYLLTSRRTQV